MEKLKIKKLTLGMMQTNCYIVENKEKSLIIDPGDESSKIINYLESNQLKIEAILLTHGHFDHIGAVDDLAETYHCPVYLHEKDYDCFYDDYLNLSNNFEPLQMKSSVIAVKDHLVIEPYHICFINLPGHTHGSCFIVFENENIIFSGDVLFKGAVGRYDFPNSSLQETLDSMEKIKALNKNYIIYPGHGSTTTLDDEKRENPYLNRF